MQRNLRIFSFLLIAALVLACAPTLVPASVPAPTFDPNSINTAIVLTAGAGRFSNRINDAALLDTNSDNAAFENAGAHRIAHADFYLHPFHSDRAILHTDPGYIGFRGAICMPRGLRPAGRYCLCARRRF
ncbi:MAG: hypothetical protein IPJ46_02290 [Anaerolineales bacterium]|nr:hypothetical protein [Anaerolineales bacterium]